MGLAKLSGTSVVASVHLIAGEVPVETLAATPARGMEQWLAVDVEQSVCFQKRGKISTIMLMTITTLDYSQDAVSVYPSDASAFSICTFVCCEPISQYSIL